MNVGGKKLYVHRIAWELANGPIPEGKIVDHACANRACVNVAHLRLATYSQNNSHLRGPKRDNTSGHRNLLWNSKSECWMVVIMKDGRQHKLGRYHDLADALRVAEAGRARLFGEFAGTA